MNTGLSIYFGGKGGYLFLEPLFNGTVYYYLKNRPDLSSDSNTLAD